MAEFLSQDEIDNLLDAAGVEDDNLDDLLSQLKSDVIGVCEASLNNCSSMEEKFRLTKVCVSLDKLLQYHMMSFNDSLKFYREKGYLVDFLDDEKKSGTEYDFFVQHTDDK